MEENKSPLIDTSVILTFATTFSYLCSFLYEWGGCTFYGISTDYIEIGLNRLLFFGAIIFVGATMLFFIAFYATTFVDFFRIKRGPATVNIVLNLLFIPIICLNINHWEGFKPFITIFIGVASLNLGLFLGSKVGGLSYKRLRNEVSTELGNLSQEAISTEVKRRSLVFKYFFRYNPILVIILFLLPIACFDLGLVAARKKTTYSILLIEKDKLVVLKKYGDIYITRPIDEKLKIVNDTLVLKKQKDEEKLHIIYRNMASFTLKI